MAGCLEADGSRTKRERWEYLVLVNIYICGHNTDLMIKSFPSPILFILGSFLQLFTTELAGSLKGPAVSRWDKFKCLDGQAGSNREHFRPNGSTVMWIRLLFFFTYLKLFFLFWETNFMKMTWKFLQFLWWVLFWFYSNDL